jgi:hypothetical protein
MCRSKWVVFPVEIVGGDVDSQILFLKFQLTLYNYTLSFNWFWRRVFWVVTPCGLVASPHLSEVTCTVFSVEELIWELAVYIGQKSVVFLFEGTPFVVSCSQKLRKYLIWKKLIKNSNKWNLCIMYFWGVRFVLCTYLDKEWTQGRNPMERNASVFFWPNRVRNSSLFTHGYACDFVLNRM